MKGIHLLCFVSMFSVMMVAEAASERRGSLRVELADEWNKDNIFDDVSEVNKQWWTGFGDTLLVKLINQGRSNNYNALSALRRIEIAKAQLAQAKGDYFPSIDLDVSYSRERSSGRLAGHNETAVTSGYYNAGATLSWQPDVFGKIRDQSKRAGVAVKISAAEYDGLMTSLEANIATTYIQLLVQKQQLILANEHTENQKRILDIVESRYQSGLASQLEVAQAKTLYYSTIASIPKLESSIDASVNALAVLIGVTTESLPLDLQRSIELPDQRPSVALGVPIDLLRRRPDVVEAELNIDLAAVELGIARKDYLPSLSIAANIGTSAHEFSDLFTNQSFTYSIVPTLSITIFDGLKRRNSTIAAQQKMEAMVESYNNTILTAVEDVRNAMSLNVAAKEYITRLEEVVRYAKEEVTLSIDLYKQGLSTFSNVVDSQLDYITYQNTLVSAKGEAITSLIQLFEALGGGWK